MCIFNRWALQGPLDFNKVDDIVDNMVDDMVDDMVHVVDDMVAW